MYSQQARRRDPTPPHTAPNRLRMMTEMPTYFQKTCIQNTERLLQPFGIDFPRDSIFVPWLYIISVESAGTAPAFENEVLKPPGHTAVCMHTYVPSVSS